MRGRFTGRRLAVVALLAPGLPLLAACSRPSAQRLNADGNHAYARGEYPAALNDYRKAQVERPDLPVLNYNAGNVLFQQGDYQRAIAESLRATRGNDADARVRAFYSVGSDYYRQGKLKEALDAFKSALRLDPNDIDTKYNVEVIQRQLDAEAAQQQQRQGQQDDNQNQPPPSRNQSGGAQPTASPQATNGQQQPQQQSQGQQQGQNQPGNQAPQQANPSQQPQQQSGQAQQAGQAGQPGQPGQNGQQGQTPQGAGSQPSGGQPSANAGQGAGGTPQSPLDARQQQQQLNGELQSAINAYQQSPSIEGELRILDILAEQERIAQAEQGIRSDPRSSDK